MKIENFDIDQKSSHPCVFGKALTINCKLNNFSLALGEDLELGFVYISNELKLHLPWSLYHYFNIVDNF